MPIPIITDYIRRHGPNNPIAKKAISIMDKKARLLFEKFKNQLVGQKILDLGSGAGSISNHLLNHGYKVTSLDVRNLNIYNTVQVKTYDGHHIPYPDKEFDTAIIIHVLHHCQIKEQVLTEAMRVAKRVIFIEDTYYNPLDWIFLQVQDALTNFEFRIHDFETVDNWQQIITDRGWRILSIKRWHELFVTSIYSKYVMFTLE